MAVRYSNGSGAIMDKDLEKPIANIRYQLMETSKTKYTTGKWWGEFSIKKEIKRSGNYILEFEGGRKGECLVSSKSEASGSASRYHYSFFGRGPLGRRGYK
jgi:hypothetical protein